MAWLGPCWLAFLSVSSAAIISRKPQKHQTATYAYIWPPAHGPYINPWVPNTPSTPSSTPNQHYRLMTRTVSEYTSRTPMRTRMETNRRRSYKALALVDVSSPKLPSILSIPFPTKAEYLPNTLHLLNSSQPDSSLSVGNSEPLDLPSMATAMGE